MTPFRVPHPARVWAAAARWRELRGKACFGGTPKTAPGPVALPNHQIEACLFMSIRLKTLSLHQGIRVVPSKTQNRNHFGS
ncbi:MAG: hypothetical protein ACOYNN_01195 [Terrimicrobiaceae bacterium]